MNKSKIKYHCKDCGKELNLSTCYKKTERCKSCSNKFHKHNFKVNHDRNYWYSYFIEILTIGVS